MKKNSGKLKKMLAFSMAAVITASAGCLTLQSAVSSGGITVQAAEAETGSCGEGLTYTLDDDELTIIGNGEIDSYAFADNRNIR